MTIYTAEKIFTGSEWLLDHALIVDNNMITDIVPFTSLPADAFPDSQTYLIAPSFIDLQIYGAGDRLFAVYPETDSLEKLEDYCRSGGANHFMPTVATNTYEVFYKAIDAVRAYWEKGGEAALGLHIEGPWINPLKRGAHIESLIHSPTIKQVKTLLDYGKGVIKMITLAPEICTEEVIDLIASDGIIISAGHSNATFDEGTAAFNKHIRAATHLFNAMSPVHHRKPGLPVAIMNHGSVMCSIIPDNIHVSFEMVALAKKLMEDRLFIITDAVTETRDGFYQHTRDGDRYVSDGILSGSTLTMMQAVKNCVNHVGIKLSDALQMAGLHPARLINRQEDLGIIKKGIKANLVFIDEELNAVYQ